MVIVYFYVAGDIFDALRPEGSSDAIAVFGVGAAGLAAPRERVLPGRRTKAAAFR